MNENRSIQKYLFIISSIYISHAQKALTKEYESFWWDNCGGILIEQFNVSNSQLNRGILSE
jgi:hypothetical protein